MIRILGGIYVHFTTVLLFVFCYINRRLETVILSYGAVFLHEIAHLIAALIIGLKPSHIILFPFGTNLKLKNSIVYSLSEEILLYLSGPLLNIVLCLFCLPFLHKNNYIQFFYYNNLGLFIFNLLPILPMDGGIVLKKILTRKVGSRRAENILKAISVFLIVLLMTLEIYLLWKNNFNFTILFAVIFLTGNIFTNREKYHIDFTKELMFYKNKDKKKIKKVKGYMIKNDANLKELAKNFSCGSNYIIFKENKTGKIDKILTEREIIEEILK